MFADFGFCVSARWRGCRRRASLCRLVDATNERDVCEATGFRIVGYKVVRGHVANRDKTLRVGRAWVVFD